jgi:hypothetical protein
MNTKQRLWRAIVLRTLDVHEAFLSLSLHRNDGHDCKAVISSQSEIPALAFIEHRKLFRCASV